jgi:hypothetical protein
MTDDIPPDIPEVEPVEVEPVDEVHRPKHPCPHCGGNNFARSLMLQQVVIGKPGSFSGYLGIQYWITRPGSGFITYSRTGVEPVHATICKDCGTIVRMYVLNTDRDWTRWQRRDGGAGG